MIKKVLVVLVLILLSFNLNVFAGPHSHEWNSNGWVRGNITDEFGEKIADSMYLNTTGVFENSATSETYLYVRILIYKNKGTHIGIFLHEYSPYKPAQYFISKDSYLLMKPVGGEKVKFTCLEKWNTTGISVHSWDIEWFLNIMTKSSGIIKCYMNDGYSSRYNFNITADGFNKLYDSLK